MANDFQCDNEKLLIIPYNLPNKKNDLIYYVTDSNKYVKAKRIYKNYRFEY